MVPGINGILRIFEHCVCPDAREAHAAMSLFHLILLSATGAPFALATCAAFLRWQPSLTDAQVEFGQTATVRPRRMPFEAQTLQLPEVLRSVAHTLGALATARFVHILLAVNPGQTVHADPVALNAILLETIGTAVRAAPGGQVLVSVRPLGGQMHILVTDDDGSADQNLRESLARGAGDLIALQGGTIAVDARPGRGTTVTLRLPSWIGAATASVNNPVPIEQAILIPGLIAAS
jgi:hypothetical protein